MKKINTKLLLILLLFIGEYSVFAENKCISMELHKIKSNNSKIDSLLNKVICANQSMLKERDCFLLLEMIQAEKDTNYVSITIYEKSKFIINGNNILGYFQRKEQIVLVLGKCLWGKMQLLNEKRKFTFKCKEINKRDTIPPPPLMYNPPNYIFPTTADL
jgi:hypothetical protein